MFCINDYDYDMDELRLEAAAERKSYRRLAAHPDPSDPEYPEFDDENEDEEEVSHD